MDGPHKIAIHSPHVDLTGSIPSLDTSGSVAGAIHEWDIKTNYYSAKVPIWIDEIADQSQWEQEFSREEAKEVVEAIGGWIYCFEKKNIPAESQDRDNVYEEVEKGMKAVEAVVTNACGYAWEGTRVAVAMASRTPKSTQNTLDPEEWEERCREYGFEFVDAAATGKNEFGELVGLARLKEALETNDWSPTTEDTTADEAFGDFEAEKAQLNAELWGLKASLLDPNANLNDDVDFQDEEAMQVEDMQRLMSQALAIRGRF